MKQIVSSLALACATATTSVGAQTIEFSQLGAASLGAPLPVASFGTSYAPLFTPYVLHTLARSWGYGSFTGNIIPSISFGVDDNKGTPVNSSGIPTGCGGNFPKHLGTDYAAAAGTPVYAIADGIIRKANYFTTGLGDYHIVVESGNTDKWTTLYGHLNPTADRGTALSKPVKKGELIGTLFNYRVGIDIPHLHMGIHKGAYVATGNASMVMCVPLIPNIS
jgi:murein DD-endopeptidase MepM/ murein hydrolase activator NlpD